MTTANAKKATKTTKTTSKVASARTEKALAEETPIREQIAAATDSARRTALDLGHASAEAIGDARSGIDGAVRRAGKVGRDVYLASLGAVATADERGRALWNDLVEQGEQVAQRDVKGTLRDAGTRLKRFSGRVESAVGKQVQTGLERLGVPTRREIRQLTSRIEALSAKIDQGAPASPRQP